MLFVYLSLRRSGANALQPALYHLFPLYGVPRSMRAYTAQWLVYHADVDGLHWAEVEQRAAATLCALCATVRGCAQLLAPDAGTFCPLTSYAALYIRLLSNLNCYGKST